MSKLGNLGALTGLEIEEEEEEDEVFDQTYEDHTTMEDDRQNSISIRCLFSPIFSFTLVLFDKGPLHKAMFIRLPDKSHPVGT